jgi:hypothetical protein
MLWTGCLDVPCVSGILGEDLGPSDEPIRERHAVRDEWVAGSTP